MNGAHLHLVTNHLATVMIPVALVFLIYSLRTAQPRVTQFSLWVLLVSLLAVAPALWTGEPAEHILKEMPDFNRQVVHDHEEAGEKVFWLAVAVAAITLGAALAKPPRIKRILTQLAVAGAIVTVAALARVANLGGKIRHPEIEMRTSSALPGPASRMARLFRA